MEGEDTPYLASLKQAGSNNVNNGLVSGKII